MEYDINIDSYIGYPISKEWVGSKLKAFAGRPVTVRINSYGGDVQTALDIRQQFIDHGNVTAYIYGMTASAATILAMGAKSIKMSRYALMLVHRCSGWVLAWGSMNAEELEQAIKDLRSTKADLETIDHVICELYAQRTGQTPQKMAEVMQKAAWLSADDCLALHLIDEVIEDGAAEPVTDSVKHQFAACGIPVPSVAIAAASDLSNYAHKTPVNNKSQSNQTKMETQKFPLLAALIDLAVFADKDGKVYEDQEAQLTALEGKLAEAKAAADKAAAEASAAATESAQKVTDLETAKAAAEKSVSELTAKITELEEQVKNLKAADGAEDNDPAAASNNAQHEDESAFALYDHIKAVL